MLVGTSDSVCPLCGAIFNGAGWERPHLVKAHHRAPHAAPRRAKATATHHRRGRRTGHMPPALARYWRTHKRVGKKHHKHK